MEESKFGPSGGDGGLPIEGYVIPAGAHIYAIEVTSGWYVDSIRVIYTDAEGGTHALPGFGGNGSYAHRFTLEPGEYLIGVSGRSGRYVDSIAFHTNLRVSPTYGGDSGENAFTFLAPEASEVVGFFGRADWYVDAIGIVTRPRPAAIAAPATETPVTETPVTEMPAVKPKKPAKKAAVLPLEAAGESPKAKRGRKPTKQLEATTPVSVEAAPQAEKPAKKSKKSANLSETAPVAATLNNLEIIEGIGPKIAGLLAQHNITTFAALAATPAEQLRALLLAAGRRFAVSDPTTWPAQAALAAKGDMDALKAMQAELKGGRKVQ
ncbi:MAG TPA: hypothetical protein DCL15_11740 [Chloroflexi bacterium]|nr:hypothetical protein [Chloroflexota bacterium]HHW87577.1 hypothetical protein [Chloroflexota bacterium]